MKCFLTTTVEVEIEYAFTPGQREIGPSLNDPGSPAEGPEINVSEVWLTDGNGKRILEINGQIKGWEMFEGLFSRDINKDLIAAGSEAYDDERDRAAEARADARRDERE